MTIRGGQNGNNLLEDIPFNEKFNLRKYYV